MALLGPSKVLNQPMLPHSEKKKKKTHFFFQKFLIEVSFVYMKSSVTH